VTANRLTTQCHAYDRGTQSQMVFIGSQYKQLVKPVWRPSVSIFFLQHK